MRAMSSSLEYRFMYNVTLETAARSAHTKAAAAKKNAHLEKWRHISKGSFTLHVSEGEKARLVSDVFVKRKNYQQESPPALTQEAYRPQRSKCFLCCSLCPGGGGVVVPILVGEGVPTLAGGDLPGQEDTYPM